ncbi:MAG: radical SAM protein [Ruthenibacterium sp.]
MKKEAKKASQRARGACADSTAAGRFSDATLCSAADAVTVPVHCTLCPRRCGADRTRTQGFCGGGARVRLARAALHFWEEPCISGTRGSGTVFFSGCPLQCCYCQNYRISAQNFGKEISVQRLAEIFLGLQTQGAHNINLVSATQYLPWVLAALRLAKPALCIPVVYNTGGYESPEALAALDGFVDIYLTDLKYCSPTLSAAYSGAADYFDVASAAARAMLRQTGAPQYSADGTLRRGTILRHLALPGAAQDSADVLDFFATLPRGGFLLSLMSQYTPFYKACEHKPLTRRISTYEYRQIINRAVALGLTDGYLQKKSSAKEEYTPDFNCEGVEE